MKSIEKATNNMKMVYSILPGTAERGTTGSV